MRELAASVGQRLLGLMDHYRGAHNSYNEQVLWHLHQPCDVTRMRVAVQQLHDRHEALRTTFVRHRRNLRQVVNPPTPVTLGCRDVTGEADPRAAARAIIAEQVTTPIDLSRWPTRSVLITVAPQHHILVLTVHHYVTDDWSNALLLRDIRQLYESAAPLPEIEWQYPQWADWHRQQLEGQAGARLVTYWRNQLSGAQLVELPKPEETAVQAKDAPALSVELSIPAAVTTGLQRLAREHRTTLFPVTLSLFYAALQRATGHTDLTVASLFANRSRPEVHATVGFFVTMVLLRCQATAGQTFAQVLTQVRRTVMDGLRHQELPAQMLPPGTVSGAGRPDDVMFQQLGSFLPRADMSGDELDDLEVQLSRNRFALEFVVVPQGEALAALAIVDRERVNAEWARRLVEDYVRLAATVVEDPTVVLHRG